LLVLVLVFFDSASVTATVDVTFCDHLAMFEFETDPRPRVLCTSLRPSIMNLSEWPCDATPRCSDMTLSEDIIASKSSGKARNSACACGVEPKPEDSCPAPGTESVTMLSDGDRIRSMSPCDCGFVVVERERLLGVAANLENGASSSRSMSLPFGDPSIFAGEPVVFKAIFADDECECESDLIVSERSPTPWPCPASTFFIFGVFFSRDFSARLDLALTRDGVTLKVTASMSMSTSDRSSRGSAIDQSRRLSLTLILTVAS
jgi:hypothetical protein